MPFRRKSRNPFFSSSRSADKENAHDGMQEPMLPPPPTSPRMFRCHSDNSQRTCCDINPNTVSSGKNIMHRNSVLSTKEKMANLLQLNSTLVKEVSFLRNAQHSLSLNVENLKEELQSSSLDTIALRTENQELAQQINKLKTTHSEMKESLEAEKTDTEGRLECVSLVVDNLQSMNGVLAAEAARLREDADRYATERHSLLADLDKMMGEKSFLEEFVESLRASKEEIHEQMQQALLQAEREKKALHDEKEALLEENKELQIGNEELKKEVEELEAEKISAREEKADIIRDKASLGRELSTTQTRLREISGLLAHEKQALASAQEAFSAEKKQMHAEKEELERCRLSLLEDLQKLSEQFHTQRQALECEARECSLRIKVLSAENDALKQATQSNHEMIRNLQQELVLSKAATTKAETEGRKKEEAISRLERGFKDAATKASNMEGELMSRVKALQCELDTARKALGEEKSLAKGRADEVAHLKERFDEATHEKSALESKLIAEKEKQKRLESHIQTMKGDLLVAEDAAIQAQNKAKAVEKEAGMVAEKRSREASQKIGALESKLMAMAERQSDLENHIRFKETALKAAVQAGNEARGKLKGLKEGMQAKGRNIEGCLEAVRASMVEMQRSAMRGSESIASLQAELASLMDMQAEPGNKGKNHKRGRSRARQSSRARSLNGAA